MSGLSAVQQSVKMSSLTNSSEVRGHKGGGVRRQKSVLGRRIVAVRAFAVDCFGRAVGEILSVDVLGDQTFDVAGVAWHVLVPDFVGRSSNPVFGKSASVSVDELGLL